MPAVHPVYGISAPEKQWVPAPTYLLRRDRVLRLVSQMPKGMLLEVGCGAGALLWDLSRMGFRCTGFEISAPAAELARYVNRCAPEVRIVEEPAPEWTSQFAVVVALEVLEHIEDDVGALRTWLSWLQPDGLLVISVPAHPRRWTASDRWAGHVRRYDRYTIAQVLDRAGGRALQMECYGFPLANVLEPLRDMHYSGLLTRGKASDDSQRDWMSGSEISGIERSLETKLYPLYSAHVGAAIMAAFMKLQDLFAATDWGTGYIVVARHR